MFQSLQHDSVTPKIKEQLRVHCFPMDGIDSLSLDPFIHQGGWGEGEGGGRGEDCGVRFLI